MKTPLRISVTGPESTGKSWLAENLALHYHTLWVKEFARDYLNTLGRDYTYEDILYIAQNQLREENQLFPSVPEFLFCDTDLLVLKIWCEVKYGKCHPWIRKQFQTHRYDLYLLCDIDLPWEYDPLREHPDQRQFLFDLYEKELKENRLPYQVISGSGLLRLQHAVEKIEKLKNSPAHQ